MTFSIAMVPVPTASSTRHAQKPAGSRRFRAARSYLRYTYFERHQPANGEGGGGPRSRSGDLSSVHRAQRCRLRHAAAQHGQEAG